MVETVPWVEHLRFHALICLPVITNGGKAYQAATRGHSTLQVILCNPLENAHTQRTSTTAWSPKIVLTHRNRAQFAVHLPQPQLLINLYLEAKYGNDC